MNNARIQEAHDLFFKLCLYEARLLHAHSRNPDEKPGPEPRCARCTAWNRAHRVMRKAQRRYMKRLQLTEVQHVN
jgi:hypothetical protein